MITQEHIDRIKWAQDSEVGRCIKFWKAMLESRGIFSPSVVYFIESTICQLEYRVKDIKEKEELR